MKELINVGYNTYYLGIPDNIIKCKKIYLFNTSDILDQGEIITLYNLPVLFEEVKKNSYVKKLERDFSSISDYFELDNIGNEEFKFDAIIYSSEDEVISYGYTLFTSHQSNKLSEKTFISKIRIYLNFSLDSDTEIEIKLVNTLLELYDKVGGTESKKLIENNKLGYNYSKATEVKKFFSENSDNYLRYTNNIPQLISNNSYSIITDCNVISNIDGLCGYKFYIENDILISEPFNNYNKFFIGSYQGDLVLFYWDSKNKSYKVGSLTEVNNFGISKEYFKGTIESPDIKDLTLDYMSYSYAIFFDKNNNKYLYNFVNKKLIKYEDDLYIDPFDPSGTVIFFKKGKNLTNLSDSKLFYKDLNGICFDINSEEASYCSLYRKIGSWYIFKKALESGNFEWIYSNHNGIVYFDISENPIIINDRCIMSRSKSESISSKEIKYFYDFYFLDSGNIIKSDLIWKNNGLSSPEYYTIASDLNDSKTIHKKNEENYKNFYIISSCPGDNKIKDNPLIDGLRRTFLLKYSLPEFSGTTTLENGIVFAYCGIIFYIETNIYSQKKLKYL